MSVTALINKPCVLVNLTIDPDDPDPSHYDQGTPIPQRTETITVCELQPMAARGAEENQRGHSTAINDYIIFFRPGENVDAGSAVFFSQSLVDDPLLLADDAFALLDGEGTDVYQITGKPHPWRNPRTGVVSHIEAQAVRSAGTEDGSGS